jgi:hypothetical protein
LSDIRYRGAPALRIPYRDRFGAEVAVRIRCRLAACLPGDPRFVWRRGDKPQLYGLERLGTPEFVVLVEGESDCHTLWHHGVPALGIPGAGTWNEARDAAHLEHVAKIYVVVEPDRGGEALLKWLARSRIRERAYLLDLAPHKDPSALHCAGPEGFEAAFAAAVARARPFAQILAAQRSRASTEAWAACRPIASAPRILEAFAAAYRAAGAVGEVRIAQTLYLALTSRFLARPVSVAVKGPSSGGKSFTVETVLRFFPPQAVHCMTAISDRALAYTEADLQHRLLVVFEAAGMVGEFASYLIRSLLSEGRPDLRGGGEDGRRIPAAAHREGGADRTSGDHHGSPLASGERDPAAVAAGHRHAGTDPGGAAGDRGSEDTLSRPRPLACPAALDRARRAPGGDSLRAGTGGAHPAVGGTAAARLRPVAGADPRPCDPAPGEPAAGC